MHSVHRGLCWLAIAAAVSGLTSCAVDIPELVSGPGADAGPDASGEVGVDVVDVETEIDAPSDGLLEGSVEGGDAAEVNPSCAPGFFDCDGDMTNGCEDVATDPAHCGQCGHGCLGGTCTTGKCQPVLLASDLGRVYTIVQGDGFLYGTSSSGGHVWKVPEAGCADPSTCAQVLSSSGVGYRSLAMDSDALFFTDWSAGQVMRVNKDGQGECVLASGETEAWGIAVDATYVYWSARSANAIKRRSKTCGAATAEVLVAQTSEPQFLTLDETGLYWGKGNGGLVSWSNLDGTSTAPVWSGSTPGNSLFNVVTDDAWVYWREGYANATNGTGRVVRAPKDRSGTLQVVAGDQPTPRYMAVDGTHAYWTTAENVLRGAKDGSGLVEALATGFASPHAILVDDEAIYFGTFWGEELFKLAK